MAVSGSGAPISVVVVNFNAGEALLDCVGAVLASTLPVAVWVVDNASQDGSVERLLERHREEPRLRVVRNPDNRGFARANNQILGAAPPGDFVLLLNPDCVVRPRTLETVRAALLETPEAGMAGCLLLGPDGSEQKGCRRALPTPTRALVRAFGMPRLTQLLLRGLGVEDAFDFVLSDQPLPSRVVDVEAISGAFMLVRTAALARVGPLDERYFLHCEDLDWCFRFGEAGYRILFVPQATAVHEKGRCSRDRQLMVQWHLHRGMLRYHLEHFRGRYPVAVTVLVVVGIWFRFTVLALPRVAWSAARRALLGARG